MTVHQAVEAVRDACNELATKQREYETARAAAGAAFLALQTAVNRVLDAEMALFRHDALHRASSALDALESMFTGDRS